MKFMVAALLLAAACQAEVARSKQKEDSRAERRAPEGVVQKRAPAVLPTASPSAAPGIEYADSKDTQTEKPAQVYSRPVTQVAKISDVLTGHGPPFPAAIASHLYSPIPVYQPRLSSPTTYEISAPIPSQLAYSEHKVSYQPQQNAIQYTPQEYNQKLPNPKPAIARLTVNYQPYPQQLLVQPQPIVYSQQQPQPIQQFSIYRQQPINQQPQQIQYNQAPQLFQAQSAYQQPLIQLVQAQPGITYAEKQIEEQPHQRPTQRELKTGQPEAVKELEERAKPQPQKNYNTQSHGAVSYASFSVGAPAGSYAQPQKQQQQQQTAEQQYQQQQLQQQYQLQPQQQQQQTAEQQYQQQQLQQQYQLQPQQQQQQSQQYQQPAQQYQPQYQQIQYQPSVIQYQPQQYQVAQYQPAPQRQIISKPEPQNLIAIPIKPNQRQISYFRQGPLPVQQLQPQIYQAPEAPGYQAAAPHFPPVQYFGKFAHSIFGQYQ